MKKLKIKNVSSKGFGIFAACSLFATALMPTLTMGQDPEKKISDPEENYQTTRYHFVDYHAINPEAHPEEDTLFTSGPWAKADGIGYLSDTAKGLMSGWGYTDGHGMVEPDYFRVNGDPLRVAYCMNMSKKAPTGQIDKGDLLPVALKRVLKNGYPLKKGADYSTANKQITDMELEWATAVAVKIVEGNNYDPETGEIVGKGLSLDDFKNGSKIVGYFYATTKTAYEEIVKLATEQLQTIPAKIDEAKATQVERENLLVEARVDLEGGKSDLEASVKAVATFKDLIVAKEKAIADTPKEDTATLEKLNEELVKLQTSLATWETTKTSCESFIVSQEAYVVRLETDVEGCKTTVQKLENSKLTYEKQIADSNNALVKIANSEREADKLLTVVDSLVESSKDETVLVNSFTLEKDNISVKTTRDGYLVGPYKVVSDYGKEVSLTLSNEAKGSKIVDANGNVITSIKAKENINDEFYVSVPLTTTSPNIAFNVRAEVIGATDIISHVYVPANKNEQTMAVAEEVNVVDTAIFNQAVHSVEITKTDLTTSEALPGATIRIKNADNEIIYESITDENGKMTPIKLTAGSYVFSETVAPDGYILSEEEFSFVVNEDGTITGDTNITNKSTEVVITKTDLTTGEPLIGATIEIKDVDGKTVFKDVTDEKGEIHAFKLPAGDYTFLETVAPEGYILSQERFNFTLNEDGTVVGDTTITNKQTEVTITKLDDETSKPLENAVFEFYNSEGEVVFEGETDEDGLITIMKLPVGTYTYKEKVAPKGYELSDKVYEFVINEDGTVKGDIEITNKLIVTEPTPVPTPEEKPTPKDPIQTAVKMVSNHLPLSLGLLGIGVLGAITVVKSRKKAKK